MSTREINFDGLVGPMHNYAGLSLGNIASASNAGGTSRPRTAALQGLGKMRALMDRRLVQGFLPPLRRPAVGTLRAVGFAGTDAEVLAAAAAEDRPLFNNICSASSMWTANAATVIAGADSADGRVHLVSANLATMLHRSIEGPETCANLRRIFRDPRHFAVHAPLEPARHFSDEGAANHMRIAPTHGQAGVNIFIHAPETEGRFPGRQTVRAGQAVARIAGARAAIHTPQAAIAIEAGAFHNDVVAVANESVLFAHHQAFGDRDGLFAALNAAMPGLHIVETNSVPLASAIATYLFNSQLLTMPEGHMALVLPAETQADPLVKAAIDAVVAGNNPVNEAIIVDVRESMRNGGGPACLRLRVPVSDAALAGIDPAFLLTEARWAALYALVERHWPESIAPADLTDPALWAEAAAAHDALEAWLSVA